MRNVVVIVNIVPLDLNITIGFHSGVQDENGNIHLGDDVILLAEDEDSFWSIIEA